MESLITCILYLATQLPRLSGLKRFGRVDIAPFGDPATNLHFHAQVQLWPLDDSISVRSRRVRKTPPIICASLVPITHNPGTSAEAKPETHLPGLMRTMRNLMTQDLRAAVFK